MYIFFQCDCRQCLCDVICFCYSPFFILQESIFFSKIIFGIQESGIVVVVDKSDLSTSRMSFFCNLIDFSLRYSSDLFFGLFFLSFVLLFTLVFVLRIIIKKFQEFHCQRLWPSWKIVFYVSGQKSTTSFERSGKASGPCKRLCSEKTSHKLWWGFRLVFRQGMFACHWKLKQHNRN